MIETSDKFAIYTFWLTLGIFLLNLFVCQRTLRTEGTDESYQRHEKKWFTFFLYKLQPVINDYWN